jgi:hypothetical protein
LMYRTAVLSSAGVPTVPGRAHGTPRAFPAVPGDFEPAWEDAERHGGVAVSRPQLDFERRAASG